MEEPRAFGNTLRLREEARDAWGWNWLDDLVQDTLDDQASTVHGQTGVTVGHESLRVVWVLDKPHPTWRLSLVQQPRPRVTAPDPSPTSWPSTPSVLSR